MFLHYYERADKCEWVGGALNEFIAYYNKLGATNYELTACLDIVRTGGNTPSAPEVLLTDHASNKQMAVERKSVVWPPAHILRHKNEHDFAATVVPYWEHRDECYVLIVSGKQIEAHNNRSIKAIARAIGSSIVNLKPSELPIRGSRPIPWVLRRADVDEHGEHKGLVVSQEDTLNFDDFTNTEAAKIGTAATMQSELNAASEKFRASGRRNVVLLDFYGTDLWEDDIPQLMQSISIPSNIHEIWMSKREWVSENDFEVGYERLFNADDLRPANFNSRG
jgi:hypothetical protein